MDTGQATAFTPAVLELHEHERTRPLAERPAAVDAEVDEEGLGP